MFCFYKKMYFFPETALSVHVSSVLHVTCCIRRCLAVPCHAARVEGNQTSTLMASAHTPGLSCQHLLNPAFFPPVIDSSTKSFQHFPAAGPDVWFYVLYSSRIVTE